MTTTSLAGYRLQQPETSLDAIDGSNVNILFRTKDGTGRRSVYEQAALSPVQVLLLHITFEHRNKQTCSIQVAYSAALDQKHAL